ncbi:hypothetical protein RIF29_38842 [Crotalaria pallida]|uniref:Uncharacterized protein n=1 Tax=Crotalaria pallida TaxID=3830 RepID=A0AAN9E0R1_CROPI
MTYSLLTWSLDIPFALGDSGGPWNTGILETGLQLVPTCATTWYTYLIRATCHETHSQTSHVPMSLSTSLVSFPYPLSLNLHQKKPNLECKTVHFCSLHSSSLLRHRFILNIDPIPIPLVETHS